MPNKVGRKRIEEKGKFPIRIIEITRQGKKSLEYCFF